MCRGQALIQGPIEGVRCGNLWIRNRQDSNTNYKQRSRVSTSAVFFNIYFYFIDLFGCTRS